MPSFIDMQRLVQQGNPAGFQAGEGGARPLRRIDPAQFTPGASPNFGDFVAPHVVTFSGVLSTMARIYRPSDEALQDSFENARHMRNDLVIMECIEARQRATALLNLHVEAPDERNAAQKMLASTLLKMMTSIPRFMQYRENLLNAVFFGRYAVAQRWRWKPIAGGRRIVVDKWRPIHGDKLVWKYEPDDAQWDEDQVGVRVGVGYAGNTIAKRWTVEKQAQVGPTDQSMAYFLRPWERPLLAIHKHYIEDGEFEAPQYAGRIHGLGVRSRIYWTWYQKQETLAWLMEYLERSAGGFEIWFYPWGNDVAKQAVERSARERMSLGRNQILVPKFMEGDQFGQWYDRIEPGMAGADALKSIIVEYFGHLLKRYILGQTLTTESSGTGLGSNLADVHLATFLQIIKYDATNLEETLTTDLLEPLIRFNFPWAVGLPFRVRIDTESENSHEKLEAYEKAWSMGLKIRSQDVYDLLGATKPSLGDDLLDKSTQASPFGGMGGPGGDQPGKGEGEEEGSGSPFQHPGQSRPSAEDQLEDDPTAEGGDSPAGDAEHYAALWREDQHPRAADGEFSSKSGGELPGLPATKGRKADFSAARPADLAAAFAAADKRGDAQYRSLPGQRSLFEEEDEKVDESQQQSLGSAAAAGAISEAQADTGVAWVKQHGHHPQWHTMPGDLWDGPALIGRIDLLSGSFAVHIEHDGHTSVYPWPGSEGKNKKKKFAGPLTPLGKGDQPTAQLPARPAKAAGMLFSRSLAGV